MGNGKRHLYGGRPHAFVERQGRSDLCHAETPAVAKALGLPTNTVRRALEELAAYQLVERNIQGAGKPDLWRVSQ